MRILWIKKGFKQWIRRVVHSQNRYTDFKSSKKILGFLDFYRIFFGGVRGFFWVNNPSVKHFIDQRLISKPSIFVKFPQRASQVNEQLREKLEEHEAWFTRHLPHSGNFNCRQNNKGTSRFLQSTRKLLPRCYSVNRPLLFESGKYSCVILEGIEEFAYMAALRALSLMRECMASCFIRITATQYHRFLSYRCWQESFHSSNVFLMKLFTGVRSKLHRKAVW